METLASGTDANGHKFRALPAEVRDRAAANALAARFAPRAALEADPARLELFAAALYAKEAGGRPE